MPKIFQDYKVGTRVIVVLMFALLYFSIGAKDINADCAAGYTCSYRTIVDQAVGCRQLLTSTWICRTQWDRRIPVTCNSNCVKYITNTACANNGGSPVWIDGNFVCPIKTYVSIHNCCVLAPCSCSSWSTVGGCGEGTCNNTQRKEVRNCNPDGCSLESRCVYSAACDTPTCSVSLDPSAVSIAQGTPANYIASVTVGNGSVDQVNFSSSNTSVASVNPTSDGSNPYQTIGSTLSAGDTIITANVVMSGATRCSDTASLEVTAPGPWWQAIDSDLVTSGDIISSIPLSCALPGCNPLLGLEGLGGFPGVPVYGGSDLDTGDGGISTPGWSANTQSLFGKIYDYSFFSKLVRPDVVLTEIDQVSVNGGYFTSGGAPSRGYVWYHFDGNNPATPGDLIVNSSVNMPGSRKVVVLVENADLYINGTINVVDGEGFMMFIVGKDGSGNKGNIYVDAGVSHPVSVELEGIFLSEGQFRTGEGDNQLHIRGMVAAYGGVVLERDLEGDNADEPAEVFEFAPDFVLTFPRDLTFKRLRWKEVAP